MSDCDRFRDLLIERLYGELSPADREALEMHLAMCQDCEAAAADYTLIHRTSSALEDISPRPETIERLLAAAQAEAVEARKVVPLFGARKALAPVLAVAATVVLAFGAVVLYERFGEDEAPGAAAEGRSVRVPTASPLPAEESAGYARAPEDILAATDEAKTAADDKPVARTKTSAGLEKKQERFVAEPEVTALGGALAKRDGARAGLAGGDEGGESALGRGRRGTGGAKGGGVGKPGKIKRERKKKRSSRATRRSADRRSVTERRAKKKAAEVGPGDMADLGEVATTSRTEAKPEPGRRYAEPPPPRRAPKRKAAPATAATPPPAAGDAAGADDDFDSVEAESAPAEAEEVLSDDAPTRSDRSSFRRRRGRKASAQAPAKDEGADRELQGAMKQEEARKESKKPADKDTPAALLARARERRAAKDCRGALDRYYRIITDYPLYRRMDLVLLEAAECEKTLGRKKRAIKLLDRLDREYPAWIDRSRKLRKSMK